MTSPQHPDQSALTTLKGVGPALEKKLAVIGIHSVQDLLFHLPLRYEDRSRINPIGKTRIGDIVQLQGEVISAQIQFGRRRSLQCLIKDKTGIISLRFFYFSTAQKNALVPGATVRCYGEVRPGRAGFEIYHPEYRILKEAEDEVVSNELTPVYPLTEGLQQGRLRQIIGQALQRLSKNMVLTDYLPPNLIQRYGLEELKAAIQLVHRPPTDMPLAWQGAGMNPGQKRLAFEELLTHRLSMRRFKLHSNQETAPQLAPATSLQNQFVASLPFDLTAAQQRVWSDISNDLDSKQPMLRLLQGDVGSGKTVVAALSSLQAIGNGFQVALMAPTEILAEQHYLNFSQWFAPLGINVGWLSGKIKGSKRSTQLGQLAAGECQILVGTHALFQDDVVYQKLGLVIIDEQHRFGVHQRLALREKAATPGNNPHQLVMTATPIPRTLAMSAYADLDCSTIDELPPGRSPVNTVIISSERREDVVQRIAKACAENKQAYWVCTLIEESEALQAQAAEATYANLSKQLPGINVGLIHGRMKPQEKQQVMALFKEGRLQLLVATTVIEVGVDVPNASLMVIENPERLGLAQLHQLRGRVGRGSQQSHCLLLYQNPLSRAGKERLAVMKESNDGFYIAEKDLELRGPGQVLGTEQTGLMSFRVADIARDASLLEDVRDAAEWILKNQPELIDPLVRRWIGERVNYVNA